MNTYEAISLMIMFSMFIILLISLIVMLTKDNIKRKKQSPCMPVQGD